jgi:hypothetical protein
MAPLLRLGILVSLLGCSEKVAEPEKRAPAPSASVAPAPPAASGRWFKLQLPPGWTEVPLENDAERGVSEGMWRAPKSAAGTSIIVFRPIPFEGDAQGFAEQSLFAYAEMGMGNMVADGDATVGGVPAKRYHGVIAVGDKGGVVAYWFFVRDGSGGGIQCGGTQIAACEAIVKTFEIVAPLPRAVLTVPPSAVRPRELPGFTGAVRDDWQLFSTVSYPDAVFQLRGAQPIAGMFPAAVMRRRPWKEGAKAWQAEVEQELAADGAKILATTEVTFLGASAPLLEVQAATKMGGYRALVTGQVSDGTETRVSCVASPLVFEALRADCMTLLKTLAPRKAGD